MIRLAALAGLAAVAACHASVVVVGELEEITALRAIPNPDLDLLFVLDNTVSMTQNQASLAANFPRMMEVLEHLDGGLPNLHIGVITADLGTLASGADQPGPAAGGCEGRGDDGLLQATAPQLAGSFISDVAAPDGTRLRNYTGELRDVFAELTNLPLDGCGFEQPLAAVRRALTNPANAGFLRPSANLAVIIISDEDDCSALDPALFALSSPLGAFTDFRCTRAGVACIPDDASPGAKTGCAPRFDSAYVEDVQPFVDALLAVKPDPRMLMVAAIAGDPAPFVVGTSSDQLPVLAPSCEVAGPNGRQVATPAVRLAAFVSAFPGSHFTSVCAPDLSAPLGDLGSAAKKLVGDPCLAPRRALTDASADPGIQPACDVIDVRDADPASPHPVPACEPGATDCFEILPDAAACPLAPDNLRIRFLRSGPVAADTWTHVRCQVHQ